MEPFELTHRDGRTAVAETPTEAVQLRAEGFREETPADVEVPSEDWSHARLDEYAVSKNLDLSGARSKADKVAAIADAESAAEQADATPDA